MTKLGFRFRNRTFVNANRKNKTKRAGLTNAYGRKVGLWIFKNRSNPRVLRTELNSKTKSIFPFTRACDARNGHEPDVRTKRVSITKCRAFYVRGATKTVLLQVRGQGWFLRAIGINANTNRRRTRGTTSSSTRERFPRPAIFWVWTRTRGEDEHSYLISGHKRRRSTWLVTNAGDTRKSGRIFRETGEKKNVNAPIKRGNNEDDE